MKNSRSIFAMVAIAFVIAIGAIAGTTANAAIVPTVGLGSAANYAILAGTPAITNTGATTIDRDVGIHPPAAQNLPSTSTSDPSDALTMFGVALAAVGILLLRRPIRQL